MRMPIPGRFRPVRFLLYLLLLFAAAVAALPLYLTAINIFKTTQEISRSPVSFPRPPVLDNIIRVVGGQDAGLWKMYFNSTVITVSGTALCILASSLAGYYLARVRTRLSGFLEIYFLLGMMVPYVIVYVPLVVMLRLTGIPSGLPVLILIFVSGNIPFSVFLYHGFIRSVPVELEESAVMDGAGQAAVFFHIVFRLVKPCTATAAIFVGLSIWNDFLTPMLIGQVQTITVGIYNAIGPYSADWGKVFAYVMFASAPVIILYLLAQRQFIEGLTAGALKG